MSFLVRGFESEIHTFQLQRSHTSRRQYILRLFTGQGASDKLTREASALSLLQNAGYPVPALLLQEADSSVLGRPFEIIERLEGQALWPVLASAENHQQSELLERFCSLLSQLHRLDWRAFTEDPDTCDTNPRLLLDETISHYRSLYMKYNLTGFLQLTDWLDTHKQAISVQPAFVHQDFHANNVFLCTDGRLVVIDWTQFAISDYRIDLAWTLLIMGDFGNPAWGKQILRTYASHSRLPMEDLDYFHVIVSMKLLASTVISLTFSPEEVGLGPETVAAAKEQKSVHTRLYQRIQTITGLTIPELEAVLR